MLWGGRFDDKLDQSSFAFSSSFGFDHILLPYEVEVNIAHVMMLNKIGLLTEDETILIAAGLEKIKEKYQSVNISDAELTNYEDIHSFIEDKLFELIGNVALKVRAGRSRNDLVATSTILWLKSAINELTSKLKSLISLMLEIAEEHVETLLPSYTHLQRAQPVSLAFHLLSYVEKLGRDLDRLTVGVSSLNKCPLGSGAIAGSTIELDREYTAKLLGFDSPTTNAMDSVNNRDFILDFLHTCSVGMIHLSSLCEDMILWNTSEFSFIKLGDKVTTGSSLMPQKKNPDLAELIRGKSGRTTGNYVSLTMTMKALPFGYSRDMQEDKEPLFDSFKTYYGALVQVEKVLGESLFNQKRFIEELKSDFILATDLADYLVMKRVSFKEAHEVVGQIVKKCELANKGFSDLTLEEYKKFHSAFDNDVFEVVNISDSLKRKKTYGSPNPSFIKETISEYRKKYN